MWCSTYSPLSSTGLYFSSFFWSLRTALEQVSHPLLHSSVGWVIGHCPLPLDRGLPGHTLAICTYTVTFDVKVMVELSEFLVFNVDEKVVHAELLCTNFHLPILVKQLKDRPGMAEDKLCFQMVLFWEKEIRQETVLLVLLSKLVTRLL